MGTTEAREIWALVTLDQVGSQIDGASRLLSLRRRRRLGEAIFHDLLQAIRDSRLVSDIVLATRDPGALALAQKAGIRVTTPLSGQVSEASLGVTAEITALLRGDLALLEGQDLAYLLSRVTQSPHLVLVPTPGSPGLSVVAARTDDVFLADFEGETLVSWQEKAGERGLTAEVHAISAGMRPSSPRDLLRVYTAARPSRAKALLKDWRIGRKLRQFEGEGS